jgi:peptidoglycan/xylan/chitin deacetylase (PgdA/CDA1 family)
MQVFMGYVCSRLWVRICGFLLLGAMGIAHAQNLSKMALLLPDGLSPSSVQVTAWTDAAQEQGYQLGILRNADFLLQGIGIRSQYSGIIIPDVVQTSMSDALVSMVQNYVTQGGNVMLVYDAGALTASGFYAVPKSRFSSLVGVDYVLYDQLRDRTVGLGPVFGPVSTLRALQVPPGKSMLYTPSAGTVVANKAPFNQASLLRVSDHRGTNSVTGTTAQFLPASPTNPGGLRGHDHSLYFSQPDNITVPLTEGSLKAHKTLHREGKKLQHPKSLEREAVPHVTPHSRPHTPRAFQMAASTYARGTPLALKVQTQGTEPFHHISGYAYGPLQYPSFVTQGVSQASILLASPQHGLVASSRSVGAGNVLFVNLPLTYLKLSEDAMPLHGFLHQFARGLLKQPRLAGVPDGIGGLVFNWHLDSQGALEPMQQLKTMGVWNHKPFSMHMTAGPDTIAIGDGLGFNLPRNPAAQQFLRDFDAQGHQVGSHGGWIHDFYGINANETNANQFQNYLVLNRDAIQRVIGHPLKEYSAPVGNNPLWALNWLERNGFGSYYSLSHTGTAATRNYRQSQRLNPSLWAFPVTPLGVAATFEEFFDLQIPEQAINQWYVDLIDFTVSNTTNRLIYAHPPGAVMYPNVMNNLLSYARQKQTVGQFRWYTMAQLATFMTTRARVNWQSSTAANGKMRVTASHPSSLATMAWTYPKNMYSQPVVVSGATVVSSQGPDWLVRVTGGTSAIFEAAPI